MTKDADNKGATRDDQAQVGALEQPTEQDTHDHGDESRGGRQHVIAGAASSPNLLRFLIHL